MYARRFTRRLLPLLVAAALPVGALVSSAASADGNNEAYKVLKTVPIPGAEPMRAFDISWYDRATDRDYVADRSNAGVDVISGDGTFVKRITANFAGVKFKPGPGGVGEVANNDTSGPNGVTVSGRWLFVSDGGSRVVNIDLTNDKVVSEVQTKAGDPLRADEMAYDAKDGILLVINNADDIPFGTLIAVNQNTGMMMVKSHIILDKADVGFDATNGAEQPQYSAETGKFYLSIPEVNCTSGTECGGSGPDGGLAVIDPHSTGNVDQLFDVKLCQPAGLTLGPDSKALLGCSVAFDTAGKAWSSTDTNTAAPASIVIDVVTGAQVRVAGVTASDEVWYNDRGDKRYYLAARGNPGGPVMGIIDAITDSLVQLVPTINTAGKTATPPFPSGSSHSLAVDSRNNHAFVPLPANNVFPSCLNGCIGIFGAPMSTEDKGSDN